LAAGFPVFLLGLLFCALPCLLPFALAKRMKLYVGYDSNIKLLAGLISFPLTFWLFYRLANRWVESWQAGLCVLGLVLAAYFAEYYWDIAQNALERWRAASAARYNQGLYRDLMAQRDAILKQTELALEN
jgi:glycerol-3-phosphate O-acyltransferase / dihydroxyacetone phosphate acyltransferase